jgi:2-oxoglutarate dehydrogenase E2 component (dihydrolipoamide succinyltransferase)
MRIEVQVPNLPESVSDATLLDWHYQAGDVVTKDQNLVDLETDKVILEVPVPETGILQEIRRSKGDVVSGGDLLAVIETELGDLKPSPAKQNSMVLQSEPASTPTSSVEQAVSPAVRRLLTEHNLSAKDIGISGRITKQDVLDYLAQEAPQQDAPLGENIAPPVGALTLPHTKGSSTRDERRLPMTRIRARIAERMVESQQTTATLTTFSEVSLHKVFELRNEHRNRFEQAHKVKLGLMSFFVKASVEALKRFPIINASLDGNDIVYHDYHDIGIAVTTDRGLVVPVLRNADHLGFAEIEKAISEFSSRARDGKLSYEELSGGTFTITNGGIFGSMLSTPILNPPQSAILGMHSIKERPVVEDGEIVIRPIIYLALSYDHRIIDGKDAVSFLFTVKELLEDPTRLLLEV